VRSERGLAPETGVASLEGDLVTLPEYLSIKEGFFLNINYFKKYPKL
jgi:hypothetical protein